jgi:hypothetical protein
MEMKLEEKEKKKFISGLIYVGLTWNNVQTILLPPFSIPLLAN